MDYTLVLLILAGCLAIAAIIQSGIRSFVRDNKISELENEVYNLRQQVEELAKELDRKFYEIMFPLE